MQEIEHSDTPPQEAALRPRQIEGAALCYCISSWLMLGISLWRAQLGISPEGVGQYTALMIVFQVAVILLPALVYLITTKRLATILAPIRIRDGLSSIGLAVFGILPVLVVNLLWMVLLGNLSQSMEGPMLPVADGASQTLLLALALAVTPGLCEEFLFRGVLLGGLDHTLSAKKALLVAGLLFGLAHMNLQQFFATFLLGIVMGYLYVKTRSIWPSILYHTTHNALLVLLYQALMKLGTSVPIAALNAPAMTNPEEIIAGLSQSQMMLIGAGALLIPALISLAIYLLLLRGISRRQPLTAARPAQPLQPITPLAIVLLVVGALPPIAANVMQLLNP